MRSHAITFLFQWKIILSLHTFWDSRFIYRIQLTKKREYYVLRTKSIPEPQYLILFKSHVQTTGDMSSTTTIELILLIQKAILKPRRALSVK